jgi:ABC-type transport system involved in cytochrome c biogenesis permease subunit
MDLLDISLYVMYLLIVVAALGALGFALINIVSQPGGLVKAGIGIGALLGLFFISYAMTSGDLTTAERARGISETTSRIISASLIMFYIAFVISILALVYAEISKAFK